jgi:hypothetical protein
LKRFKPKALLLATILGSTAVPVFFASTTAGGSELFAFDVAPSAAVATSSALIAVPIAETQLLFPTAASYSDRMPWMPIAERFGIPAAPFSA